MPENLPNGLQELNCFDNPYLKFQIKFQINLELKQTPDYNKYATIIQTKWKLKIKIKKLKFIKKLNNYINEFRYKPNGYGYLKLFNLKN